MWVGWVQYCFLPCIINCTCFKGGWGLDPRYTHMNTCCHQQHHHPRLFEQTCQAASLIPRHLLRANLIFHSLHPPLLALFEERAPGSLRTSVPLSSFPPGADGIFCHQILIIFYFFLSNPFIQSVIGVGKVIQYFTPKLKSWIQKEIFWKVFRLLFFIQQKWKIVAF